MEKYEFAIVGNGVIGTLSALKLAEAGAKVALVGPADRFGSASLAAGAMLNVFGEVDAAVDSYIARKIDIGRRAIEMWRRLLPSDIFVADQTHIYKKDNGTELEAKCFDAIAIAAEVKPKRIDNKAVLVLPTEPAVSTPALFSWLDARLTALNVPRLQTTPECRRVIKCAGAFTQQDGILPLYFGVGNAMTISDINLRIPSRTVMRTPNRGNTCGLHIVPRSSSSFYVGAGSYVAHGPADGYRIETLRYLVRCLEEDFGVETWRAAINPVKGYRPIALDGKPLLGPMSSNPDVYIATGTKRDGLTYAPIIAEDILEWSQGKASDTFKGWEPDRQPISFGPRDFAIQVYVENRIAALREHDRPVVEEHIREEAKAAYERGHARFNLPKDFGFHPEMLHVI